jgi:hypothetical protein
MATVNPPHAADTNGEEMRAFIPLWSVSDAVKWS